jgi:hypothetical protein
MELTPERVVTDAEWITADSAWIVPDTADLVHRIPVHHDRLACASWVTAAAGLRIPAEQAEMINEWCTVCWPAKVAAANR